MNSEDLRNRCGKLLVQLGGDQFKLAVDRLEAFAREIRMDARKESLADAVRAITTIPNGVNEEGATILMHAAERVALASCGPRQRRKGMSVCHHDTKGYCILCELEHARKDNSLLQARVKELRQANEERAHAHGLLLQENAKLREGIEAEQKEKVRLQKEIEKLERGVDAALKEAGIMNGEVPRIERVVRALRELDSGSVSDKLDGDKCNHGNDVTCHLETCPGRGIANPRSDD